MKNKQYKENKRIFNEAKTKCCICGETAKCCLEFHHIKEKYFNISQALRYVTTDQLIEELKLTCCMCKNCHTKYHNGLLDLDIDMLINNKVDI